MEEEEDMSPPFWLQNDGANRRGLRRSYSLFLSSVAFVIFLVVIALTFTFILVPTLHSFTCHIFKPHSVKKSWDSLNLVLVLFAILCGFLSRNNSTNESPRSYENQSFSNTPQREYAKPDPETPRPWYEYSDRTPYYRLRSFNSYPDLRQESTWFTRDERWRFYDDTHVNGYRGLGLENEEEEEEKDLGIKNIEVDTFVARDNVLSNTERTKQASETPKKIEKPRKKDLEGESLQQTEKKNKKASSSKELLTSLKGKKKKERQRSVENFQSILNSEPSSHPSSPSSSVFQNIFYSKKSKHRKLNSASPPPKHHVSSKLVSKTKPLHRNVATLKPSQMNKEEDFYGLEENVISTGNESPLIPIPPPPPPPPPFKLPAWKFRVQGDFVRIDSISSSSSGSPDLDEVVESPTSEGDSNGGEPEILLFYPSPDVDGKADNFIQKFRTGLKMEKMNSTKEKQGIGRSNLSPSQNQKPKKKLDRVERTKFINATLS